MNIAFFEVRLSSILRFPIWLHPFLLEESSELNIVYFYESADCEIEEVLSKLPKNSIIVKVEKISSSKIINQLKSYDIDRLVVMAQRIPDSCIVAAAKKLSIKTLMYQHGLYIPFMKREGGLFINNIYKTFRYFLYVSCTAKLIGHNKILLLFKYIRIFLFGHNPIEINFPYKKINVDKVLVYGQHWVDYHIKNFGYHADQHEVVGAPDFANLEDFINKQFVGDDICYIAQTLVEDGRLDRSSMLEFISGLSYALSKNNLLLKVKLHPRSDLTLYEGLPSNTIYISDDLPKSSVYIGHYSSLIAKATFVTNNIILINFPEHDIPEYIKMLSDHILDFDDTQAIQNTVDNPNFKKIDEIKKAKNIEKQDFYFNSKVISPIKEAAKEIIR